MKKKSNTLEDKTTESKDLGVSVKRNKIRDGKKIQSFFSIYLISLAIIILSISLSMTFIVFIGKSLKRLEMESASLRSLEQKYSYRDLTTAADELQSMSSKLNIKTYTKREAMVNILKVADNLNLLYGGMISKDVSSDGGVILITMSLSYAPPTAESFIKMIKDFTSSKLPMIHISKLEISLLSEDNGAYGVKMDIILSHPYVE